VVLWKKKIKLPPHYFCIFVIPSTPFLRGARPLFELEFTLPKNDCTKFDGNQPAVSGIKDFKKHTHTLYLYSFAIISP
jgi:hypothetical protein